MSGRRKILIVVGVIFGVAIPIPVIRHYQLRFAVESYVAQLKAKGEPMELAQMISPPVPSEQNGVPQIMNSLKKLENKYRGIAQTNPLPAMREVLSGKAMVGWQQLEMTKTLSADCANSNGNRSELMPMRSG